MDKISQPAMEQVYEALSLTSRYLAEAAVNLAASSVPALGLSPPAYPPPVRFPTVPPLSGVPALGAAIPPGEPPRAGDPLRAAPPAGVPLLAVPPVSVPAAQLLASNAVLVAHSAPVVALAVPVFAPALTR